MDPRHGNDAEPGMFWDSAFSNYLKDSWKTGVDIDQKPSDYVTEDILSRYWTVKAVAHVLNTGYYTPIAISADTIISQYLRVWSTLVFIGRPECITWFHEKVRSDEYFFASGFAEAPDQDHSLQAMLKAFHQEWYKFWPVRFKSQPRPQIMYKRNLDSQRVLPIISWRQLSQTNTLSRTIIYQVTLDPLCCEDDNKTVVFKVYINQDPVTISAFGKEVDTFAKLGPNCKDVIVEYLGSFIQNGKRVIILEHANGGNLRHFFQNHRGPRNNDELIYLWTKLFRLTDAVYHLHHLGRAAVGVAHRDIKFENILFFQQGNKDGYEFDLKLTDFDNSTSIQRVNDNSSHQDNYGSRSHCAPEASRILEITESKLEDIPLDSDIWQLGAVFSEALICILWDLESLSGYEQRRREETSSFQKLEDSGLEFCFHHGQKRLACIEEIHQEALQSRKTFDRISERLVALIEDDMLMPHGEGRLDPKLLSVKFRQLLERIRRGSAMLDSLPHSSERPLSRTQTIPGAMSGAHAQPRHPPHQAVRNSQSFQTSESSYRGGDAPSINHTVRQANGMPQDVMDTTYGLTGDHTVPNGQESRGSNPEIPLGGQDLRQARIPVVTANDVAHWRMNKNKKKRTDPPQGLIKIIEQLRGRDQLFIIDDAKSMKSHLPDIIRVAEAMISLAKKADLDGVELIFTSTPDEVKRKSVFTWKSETRDLVNQINARFSDDSIPSETNMENKLGTIMTRIARNGKPTSVYVLTDGVWQESDEPGGGVEAPIRTLIAGLKRKGRNRDAVTIQFIQFGDDKTGRERLAWLDDELPNSGPDDFQDFDIVDTRVHDDNLYLLMIGALCRYIDDIVVNRVSRR